LVIRYGYLWQSELRRGKEEGVKGQIQRECECERSRHGTVLVGARAIALENTMVAGSTNSLKKSPLFLTA
jgi:hypothetical protein